VGTRGFFFIYEEIIMAKGKNPFQKMPPKGMPPKGKGKKMPC